MSVWHIDESTTAAYVMAEIGLPDRRDKFLSGIVNLVGIGSLPVYTDSYGWVDCSFTWQLGEKTSLSLEGLNLTRTVRASHYGGGRTRPQNHWLNDRQVSITATMRF